MRIHRLRPRPARSVLAVVVLALLLVGCAGSSGGAAGGTSDVGSTAPAPGAESAALALEEERTVIDVRTPEEHEAGHVEGDQLLDIQAPGFDAGLADLDPDDAYVVYCRSGNRSAAATERMRAAGLDVLDGGSFDDMTAAGWPAAPT